MSPCLVLPVIAVLAVAWLAAQSDPRAESTRNMAALLDRITRENDWKTDPNQPLERAAYYRGILARKLDLRTEVQARRDLAENLLAGGESEAAVEAIEKLRAFVKQQGIVLNPNFERTISADAGIANLRLGEQRNCIGNHNAQSCVYPIRGGGIHKDERGSRAAIREYTAMLEKDPDDLAARWLLNLAYMTLGRHPYGVPARWLIPESILASEYPMPAFTDVAPAAGVSAETHAGGSVAEDFDGDGLFDLMVSSSGVRDQIRYFHNDGDGTFSDQTAAAGLEGITGGLNLVHADFNNDGRPDVLVLRGGWWGKHGKYPPSLLRNNGPNAHGRITFTDVTEQAGLMSLHPTQTAAWADFDGDGWLDLFLGHESSVEESHPCGLYRNNHDGTFTDIGPQAGLAELGYVKGVAWGDFNNDGRPDLYVSRKGAPNLLFRNDGPGAAGSWKFTDVAAQAGVRDPLHSFGTWFFDYDNDGWLDLLVTGYYTETLADIPAFHLGRPNKAETPRLYRNNGNGTFTDVTKAARMNRVILPMGANYGDLDNDGWLDCYFGTGAPEFETLMPNRMFRNDRGVQFQDVTTAGGFGQLQKGHAVSFADFDRDGDEDIFEVVGGAYLGDAYRSVLLENPGNGNRWLGLRLEGERSNRSAIGARVRVDIDTPSGARSVYRTVNSGSSFGDSPLELHIGIGDAAGVRRVEVRWPSGAVSQVSGLAQGRVYYWREDRAAPEAVKTPKSKPFSKEPVAPHKH